MKHFTRTCVCFHNRVSKSSASFEISSTSNNNLDKKEIQFADYSFSECPIFLSEYSYVSHEFENILQKKFNLISANLCKSQENPDERMRHSDKGLLLIQVLSGAN